MRVGVELVPHLRKEGRPGGVEDVHGGLASVHADAGGAVVDADGGRVAGDEALLAVALDEARLAGALGARQGDAESANGNFFFLLFLQLYG